MKLIPYVLEYTGELPIVEAVGTLQLPEGTELTVKTSKLVECRVPELQESSVHMLSPEWVVTEPTYAEIDRPQFDYELMNRVLGSMPPIQKTIMIFNSFSEGLDYYVFDGDLTEFQNVYIGSAEDNEVAQDKLNALFYTDEGDRREDLNEYLFFPKHVFKEVPYEAIAIVECGMFP